MAYLNPLKLDSPTAVGNILTQKVGIPQQSLAKIVDIAEVIELPKGHLLFHTGKVDRNIYFMAQGIARVFYNHGDGTATLCFNSEGEILLSLKSYIEKKPGYENIELLEPSRLIHLKAVELDRLFESDINIANWGRKIFELELINTEERLMGKLFKTASERYHELIQTQPQLLQRVQLGHIASYLGISQVTLSRIRSETR